MTDYQFSNPACSGLGDGSQPQASDRATNAVPSSTLGQSNTDQNINRQPYRGTVALLFNELITRLTGLLRQFEPEIAALCRDEWWAGYQCGYAEAIHEIRHNDEEGTGPDAGIGLEDTFR